MHTQPPAIRSFIKAPRDHAFKRPRRQGHSDIGPEFRSETVQWATPTLYERNPKYIMLNVNLWAQKSSDGVQEYMCGARIKNHL